MQISVLEYLERAAERWPERIAYRDEQESITFAEVLDECNRIGSVLCDVTQPKRPIIVLATKNVHVASLYLGVAAAGCFYVPLDAELPIYRLKAIFDIVQAEIVLSDGRAVIPDELCFTGRIITLDECLAAKPNFAALSERRKNQLDVDPLYVIFTSGSSGVPKGVVASHRAVIYCIDVFAETFGISESDVLGSQAPLDYIAALRDLYLPLRTGAETVLIPKSLFSMPKKLFEYVNESKITTICWVAAALSLCSELGVFEEANLDTVRRIFFAGSVLPSRHLRIWQEHLPDAVFVNHYGPTEITSSCTYYVVDHKVSDDDAVPIGILFRNADILLLDENGKPVPEGEMGEIYVRSAGLALGYFRDHQKTQESFIINPMQLYIDEIIYKTGDLGKKRPDGNYTFHGRRDSQIKHMGHRIELGEIEAAVLSLPGLGSVCCLYQPEKEMIWLFYTGTADKKELAIHLRERLPGFMIPRKFMKIDKMPRLANGKTNSNALREILQNG